MLSPERLKQLVPSASTDDCQKYAAHLSAAFSEFDIDTPLRQAAFLAQVAHESGSFRTARENLNYSSEGLLKVFPKYFSAAEAVEYHRQPERIANRVYANRMGNGPESSGDGWAYRGRGLIQITGKSTYIDCLLLFPYKTTDWLETPEGATRSAGWFWMKRGLNTMADIRDIVGISKRVNGGTIGLDHRIQLYNEIYRELTS
jgi:putative chitinase